jgi:geranylgeranyl reductase family protein
VRRTRFDALVIGSGPAGSVTALMLARGGARVALVDKATFPRDKACGDMVGPRGLQLMTDLGLPVPAGPDVGDMLVVGPTGRRVRLPSADGLTYPGHGTAVTRTVFDALLHEAAVAAGAVPFCARADEPLTADGEMDGYRLSTGEALRADFVIGADGATSGVAAAAGLVADEQVLWGFAIRTYLPQAVDLAAIVMWEPTPWRAFPGYGWVFPGAEGGANLGLGIATRADRQAGARAVRLLPAFLQHLHTVGLLDQPPPSALPRRLGGWLKMGMVGTTPARGRVLLVGDAAGLVNPLQGEGIAQAMGSGRLAAEALLAGPGQVAETYRAALLAAHQPYQWITAAAQAALVGRPRLVAAAARTLTAVGGGDSFAGGWAVFWNELLDGAPPGRHRSVATAITRLGRLATARSAAARWFAGDGVVPPGPGVPVPSLGQTPSEAARS